jgi:hypothetical protein
VAAVRVRRRGVWCARRKASSSDQLLLLLLLLVVALLLLALLLLPLPLWVEVLALWGVTRTMTTPSLKMTTTFLMTPTLILAMT